MTISLPSSDLWLDDGLTTHAPSGTGVRTAYGRVDGAARVIDLGSAGAPWHGVMAFEPEVLNVTAGHGYDMTVEGCLDAGFAGAKQDLALWHMKAKNAQDVMALSNVHDGTIYRYVRLKITVNGATPQVRLKAFIKSLSHLGAYSLAELITVQATLAQNIRNANTHFRTWMTGAISGGANSDGMYPLSDGLGNTVMVKCPARIAAEGADPFPDSNIDLRGGDEDGFNRALAAARAQNAPLTGRNGKVTLTRHKVMTGCSVALPFKTICFGPNLGAVAGFPSRGYTAGSTGAVINLTVKGPAIDLGAVPDAPPAIDGAPPPHYDKLIRIDGGYTDKGENQSTPFTAVRIRGDQSARASYDIAIQNHHGDGLEINSDTEKKAITYRFDHHYRGHALTFRSIDGASPDEVSVRTIGTFCSGLVYAQEGGQYSYRVDFCVENVMPWAGSYAIEDCSRKSSCYAGEIRAVYGDLMKVETRSSGYSGGGPNLVFDNLRVIQHYCGRITLINPKSVGGTLYHDQVDNSREGGTNTSLYRNSDTAGQPTFLSRALFQPAFQIGAVLENCTLTYVSRRNTCPVGARIGISDWVNPVVRVDGVAQATEPGSAFSGKSIRLEIEMGDRNNPGEVAGSFSGTDFSVPAVLGEDGVLRRPNVTVGLFLRAPGLPYWLRVVTAPSSTVLNAKPISEPAVYTINQAVAAGDYIVDTTAPASMFTAIWADYGTGSTIWADGNLQGNILVSKGWQRGTIHVSAAWVRAGYTAENLTGGTTELIIHGPITFAELRAISWKFEGIKALDVTDFGGLSMRYDGAHWVPARMIDVPKVSIAALGSGLNAVDFKRLGLSVIDQESGTIFVAQGPEMSDPWLSTAGISETPDYLPQTVDFNARQRKGLAYDGLSDDAKRVYDRLFHDLIHAGVYAPNAEDDQDASGSLLKAIYLFNGPSEGAAVTNLLFNFWELTPSDGLTHLPKQGYDPGAANTGAYLEVNGFADNRRGISRGSIALGACAEGLYDSAQQNQKGNPFTLGSDKGYLRTVFHRADGGNNVVLYAKEGAGATTYQPGNYRMGMGFTGTDTAQGIMMHGGALVESAKEMPDYNPPTDDIGKLYAFRAQDKYLSLPLSMMLIGQGTGWTAKKVEATLTALNLARAGLRAL